MSRPSPPHILRLFGTHVRLPTVVGMVLCFSLAMMIGCSRGSRTAGKDPSVTTTEREQSNKPRDQRADSEQQSSESHPIQDWGSVADLKKTIAIFETVFWEPRDTISLRKLIRETELVNGKKILEIGTGSGLISLCSLAAGADSVVATDVNQAAIANARFNAKRLGFESRLEARLVSLDDSGAYAVVADEEKFDLILSNPPWEDDAPQSIDEFALYDPGFKLIDGMLKDLKLHLKPNGKAYLAYGCVSAIKLIQKLGIKYDLQVKILDERDLDELDEVFLPGMMLEIIPNETQEKD